jgi:hypothetical protein
MSIAGWSRVAAATGLVAATALLGAGAESAPPGS